MVRYELRACTYRTKDNGFQNFKSAQPSSVYLSCDAVLVILYLRSSDVVSVAFVESIVLHGRLCDHF